MFNIEITYFHIAQILLTLRDHNNKFVGILLFAFSNIFMASDTAHLPISWLSPSPPATKNEHR